MNVNKAVYSRPGFSRAAAGRRAQRILCALAPVAMTVIALVGCASTPSGPPPDIAAVLGGGADIYLNVPVASNRALLDELSLSSAQGEKLVSVLDRTELASGAVTLSTGSVPASAAVVARGNFPSVFNSFVFTKKRGWKAQRRDGLGVWYTSATATVAIPRSGYALVAAGADHEERLILLLERWRDGSRRSDSLPQPDRTTAAVSDLPSQFFDAANSAGQSIALFINKPDAPINRLFGPLLQLPLSNAVMYLLPQEENYRLSTRLNLSDPRAGRAVTSLLGLLLNVSARIEGESVVIEPIEITRQKLAELSSSLYINF